MRLDRRLVPLALVLLAALTMSIRIAHNSLWNDEAFSFFVARGGPMATVRFIAQDTQPPVYYLALSLWLRLGHGELALRGLSVLAMALSVLPLYGAARRLCDAPTAAIAGLLFALAPTVAFWAQRARPYALQTFFLSVAFWGFAEVYCAAAAREEWIGHGIARAFRTRRIEPARTDVAWLACALGAALAMLTQQPAGFFLLGLNAAALLGPLPRLRANRRWLINWTVSQLAMIGLWLLWLPWFRQQIAINLTPERIAQRHTNFLIDGWGLVGNLEGVFGIGSLWRAAPPFLVLLLGTAAIGAGLLVRERRAIPVLVPILVPIAACVLGFLMIHPVFGYVIATFVFIWIPYTILLGYAIVHLRPRLLGAGVLGLILLGEVWGLRNYYLSPSQPIKQVAAIIRQRMQPGDGVILADNTAMRWGLAYYLRHEGARMPDGLDVSSEWDFHRLIRSPEAALRARETGHPAARSAILVSLAVLRSQLRRIEQRGRGRGRASLARNGHPGRRRDGDRRSRCGTRPPFP